MDEYQGAFSLINIVIMEFRSKCMSIEIIRFTIILSLLLLLNSSNQGSFSRENFSTEHYTKIISNHFRYVHGHDQSLIRGEGIFVMVQNDLFRVRIPESNLKIKSPDKSTSNSTVNHKFLSNMQLRRMDLPHPSYAPQMISTDFSISQKMILLIIQSVEILRKITRPQVFPDSSVI